jgi:hypothetical protein
MNEKIKKEENKPIEFDELSAQFDKLDDQLVANSILTKDLFISGKEGEEAVIERISKLKENYSKNDAFFRVAKLYYENNNDINTALKLVDKISNQEEQSRCLVHLANEVLVREKNIELADEIISRIKEDGKGLKKYYEKERQKLVNDIEMSKNI